MIQTESSFKTYFIFLLFFILLLLTGFSLAVQKPLWGDEIFTQVDIIHQSYSNLLLVNYPESGNSNAPLFYILQKAFCDLFHFDIPQEWLSKTPLLSETSANIFLRILPVIWMSLAFLVILIYFSYRFNLLFGMLGLFLALSSPILWTHWAEARPYGLWVLLTCLQMTIFIQLLEEKTLSFKKIIGLGAVHLALSLTCTLSIIQIVTVSLLLLFKKYRWYQYLFLLGLPSGIVYFYRPHLPFNDLLFIPSVGQIFNSALSGELITILFFYPLMLVLYYLQNKKAAPQIFVDDSILKSSPFFLAIFILILEACSFLSYLRWHAAGINQIMMPRHVIFLAPVGVIAVTYLLGCLWQSLSKCLWLKIPVFAVIAVLLLCQMLQFPWYKILPH